MTDKYTPEEVMDALKAAGIRRVDRECILGLLTSKPKFTDGQVVYYHTTGDYGNYNSSSIRRQKRALNQTEVGPDWVPRDAVIELRGCMENIATRPRLNNSHYQCEGAVKDMQREAHKALERFDKAIKLPQEEK